MSLDLAPALYAAITASSTITSQLGTFNSVASVHTRRPVPEDAGYPMVVISADITVTDEDGINDDRPVVTRDIAVYGEAAAHYRIVESLAYTIRTLFHRQRQAISVTGYTVIDIRALGPRIAPTDATDIVGRLVTLTIRLAGN